MQRKYEILAMSVEVNAVRQPAGQRSGSQVYQRQASSHHSMACPQSKGAIPKVVHDDEDDMFLSPKESLLTKGQFGARKAVSNDLLSFSTTKQGGNVHATE